MTPDTTIRLMTILAAMFGALFHLRCLIAYRRTLPASRKVIKLMAITGLVSMAFYQVIIMTGVTPPRVGSLVALMIASSLMAFAMSDYSLFRRFDGQTFTQEEPSISLSALSVIVGEDARNNADRLLASVGGAATHGQSVSGLQGSRPETG